MKRILPVNNSVGAAGRTAAVRRHHHVIAAGRRVRRYAHFLGVGAGGARRCTEGGLEHGHRAVTSAPTASYAVFTFSQRTR